MNKLSKSPKKELCAWCKHNGFRCGKEEFKTCDFKSLKMEKEAIIDRIEGEIGDIESLKVKIRKGNVEATKDLVDKSSGIAIMFNVLESEFGLPKADAMKQVGMKELSFVDKAKLAGKIAMLQAKRRGK